jgi:hypothetical protein
VILLFIVLVALVAVCCKLCTVPKANSGAANGQEPAPLSGRNRVEVELKEHHQRNDSELPMNATEIITRNDSELPNLTVQGLN